MKLNQYITQNQTEAGSIAAFKAIIPARPSQPLSQPLTGRPELLPFRKQSKTKNNRL